MANGPAHVVPPRVVFFAVAGLALAAIGMVVVLGHSTIAVRTAVVALAAQTAIAGILAVSTADAMSPVHAVVEIALLDVIAFLLSALGWFFGPHSGFAAFVALVLCSVGVLSRGEAVIRPQLVGWSIFAATALGQATVVVAVACKLVPDVSLVPVLRSGQGMGQLAAAHVGLQVLFFASFVSGRIFQRRYNELAERVDATVRTTAQREALLEEARAEYRRALAIGKQGVFSGSRVGGYRLQRLIGRGAAGEVYEAVHDERKVRAALKLLRGDRLDEPTLVERFVREARIAMTVKSPHVARVLEVSTTGIPFIAMEPIEGETLETIVRRDGPMRGAELSALVDAVTRALESVHAAGALHLDVSPRNVMRTSDRGKHTVPDRGAHSAPDGRFLLVDFGVAQLQSALDARPAGTPPYVAPERLEGEPVDARADLYALAAVVYFACTGREPIVAADGRVRDPRAFAPISESFAYALGRGLDRDPTKRPSTAAEIRAAFLEGNASNGETRWSTVAASIPPPANPSLATSIASSIASSKEPRGESRAHKKTPSVPPRAESSGSFASVGSSAHADVVRYKMRFFKAIVSVLCGFGMVIFTFIVHEQAALYVAWASMALIVVMIFVQDAMARRNPHVFPSLPWTVLGVLSVGPAYALGIDSALGAVIALMVFAGGLFATSELSSWRRRRGLVLGVTVGAHTATFALVLAGVVPDLGNQHIVVPGRSVGEAIALHALLMAVYAASFAVGLAVDRRFESLTKRAELATREAAQKEALLSTAQAELERALGGERQGIFSGLSVGGYDVGRLLGRGAMGEVYEATRDDVRGDALSGAKRFALKLVRGDCVADPKSLRMFLAEADALRRVRSDHVARVFDVAGIDDEVPFIAMEFIDGPSLTQLLRRKRRLEIGELRLFVRHVARGLADVHRAGVVHRDIKPGNVIHVEPDAWKLVDFGVATLVGSGTRSLVGTPSYMAPEQALGEEIDARADLYSLCLVVYRALTGRPAFDSNDPEEVARIARSGGPPDPRSFVHDLSEPLRMVLRIGLAGEARDRFRDADELASAFEEAFERRIEGDLKKRAVDLMKRTPWRS